MDGRSDRRDELIDTRHVLLGIDEEPLPIECDHLNLQRLRARAQGFRGIKVMRSDPGDAAEKQNDEGGDRPDQNLEAA